MEISEFNKILKETLDMEPLTEYTQPKTEMEHEMREGLAQMYANKGFRNYLERATNIAIHNAAISSGNEEMRGVFKGRVLTCKELLLKAKNAFEQYEKFTNPQRKKK